MLLLVLKDADNILACIQYTTWALSSVLGSFALQKAGHDLKKIILNGMSSLQDSSKRERERVLANIDQIGKNTKNAICFACPLFLLLAWWPWFRAKLSYVFLMFFIAIVNNAIIISKVNFPANLLRKQTVGSDKTDRKDRDQASTVKTENGSVVQLAISSPATPYRPVATIEDSVRSLDTKGEDQETTEADERPLTPTIEEEGSKGLFNPFLSDQPKDMQTK